MVAPYAIWVLVALGCSLVLGLVLTIRGLRGRRVGTGPHCRRCGYDLTGGLTQEQQERFRDQLVTFTMKFRPRIRRGEKLSIDFNWRTMGASGISGSYKIEQGELRIGSWTREFHWLGGDSLGGNGSGGGTKPRVATAQFEPGTYSVELRATKKFEGRSFSRPIQLVGELTILPPGAEDTLQLVGAPSRAVDFRRAIEFKTANTNWGHRPEIGKAYVELMVGEGIPMDAAFDLFARIGDAHHHLGEFAVRMAESKGFHMQFGRPLDLGVGECFVPVLRTNPAEARREPDIFEVWDGEIVFNPVCVEPPVSMITLDVEDVTSDGLTSSNAS